MCSGFDNICVLIYFVGGFVFDVDGWLVEIYFGDICFFDLLCCSVLWMFDYMSFVVIMLCVLFVFVIKDIDDLYGKIFRWFNLFIVFLNYYLCMFFSVVLDFDVFDVCSVV